MKNFFRNGYWVLVLFVAGSLWLLYAIREDTDAYLKEGKVTLGVVLDYDTSADDTYVKYGFYVNGKAFEDKRLAHKFHKKGDFIYVLHLESDPVENVILFNKRVRQDSTMNVEITHIVPSKQEIRDAIMGKKR